MPAKLTLYPRHRASRLRLLDDGQTITIGRDNACDFAVDDPWISKAHAALVWSGTGWRIEDLGSKNGTTVNDRPPLDDDLRHGDWLGLGGIAGRFDLLTRPQAAMLASERLERIETTAKMRRRLGAELAPTDLLLRFLESAMEVARTERGFVLLVRPGGTLRAEVAIGFSPDHVSDQRFRGSVGAVRQALASKGLVVSDVASDPVLGKRTSVVTQGIRSLACVPLRFSGEMVGLVYLDSRTRVPEFSALDLEILETLADHTAAVLGSYPLERRLADGTEDALVGQLQRRIEELLPAVEHA